MSGELGEEVDLGLTEADEEADRQWRKSQREVRARLDELSAARARSAALAHTVWVGK